MSRNAAVLSAGHGASLNAEPINAADARGIPCVQESGATGQLARTTDHELPIGRSRLHHARKRALILSRTLIRVAADVRAAGLLTPTELAELRLQVKRASRLQRDPKLHALSP